MTSRDRVLAHPVVRVEYYCSMRVRYHVAVGCLALIVAVTTTVLIIGVVGASTANPRTHGGIVVISLLLAGVIAGTIFSRASPLIE